jgi:hypothetical protein
LKDLKKWRSRNITKFRGFRVAIVLLIAPKLIRFRQLGARKGDIRA